MSFAPPLGKRKNTFNIVRQVNVDESALIAIARALGVPQTEHDRIESVTGEIVIRPASRRTVAAGAAQGSSALASSDEYPPPKGPAGTGS
jgi:hypothetical protein